MLEVAGSTQDVELPHRRESESSEWELSAVARLLIGRKRNKMTCCSIPSPRNWYFQGSMFFQIAPLPNHTIAFLSRHPPRKSLHTNCDCERVEHSYNNTRLALSPQTDILHSRLDAPSTNHNHGVGPGKQVPRCGRDRAKRFGRERVAGRWRLVLRSRGIPRGTGRQERVREGEDHHV